MVCPAKASFHYVQGLLGKSGSGNGQGYFDWLRVCGDGSVAGSPTALAAVLELGTNQKMNKSRILEQLESSMRPGQSSQGGFLGLNESLEIVITQDEQTLEKFGISHEQIAGALERVIAAVHELKTALPYDKLLEKETDFPDLYHPEKNPLFSKK